METLAIDEALNRQETTGGGFPLKDAPKSLVQLGPNRATELNRYVILQRLVPRLTQFLTLLLAQLVNVFACRSDRLSAARTGWFTNPLILWGIAIELTLLAIITYAPISHTILGTSALPAWIFGPLALSALVRLIAEEGRKIIANRLHPKQPSGSIQEVSAT